MRLKVYLMVVVRALSLVSRTKTASSFAGSVLLALPVIEWIAPGGSDQPSPARQMRVSPSLSAMDCLVKPGNDGCASSRHMRRYREPFPVLLRPAIGVATRAPAVRPAWCNWSPHG